ncbi:hypothetical protein DFJ74DRAFT_746897, partial [Hyaloraphidium curvatum]
GIHFCYTAGCLVHGLPSSPCTCPGRSSAPGARPPNAETHLLRLPLDPHPRLRHQLLPIEQRIPRPLPRLGGREDGHAVARAEGRRDLGGGGGDDGGPEVARGGWGGGRRAGGGEAGSGGLLCGLRCGGLGRRGGCGGGGGGVEADEAAGDLGYARELGLEVRVEHGGGGFGDGGLRVGLRVARGAVPRGLPTGEEQQHAGALVPPVCARFGAADLERCDVHAREGLGGDEVARGGRGRGQRRGHVLEDRREVQLRRRRVGGEQLLDLQVQVRVRGHPRGAAAGRERGRRLAARPVVGHGGCHRCAVGQRGRARRQRGGRLLRGQRVRAQARRRGRVCEREGVRVARGARQGAAALQQRHGVRAEEVAVQLVELLDRDLRDGVEARLVLLRDVDGARGGGGAGGRAAAGPAGGAGARLPGPGGRQGRGGRGRRGRRRRGALRAQERQPPEHAAAEPARLLPRPRRLQHNRLARVVRRVPLERRRLARRVQREVVRRHRGRVPPAPPRARRDRRRVVKVGHRRRVAVGRGRGGRHAGCRSRNSDYGGSEA